jgi:hypothetical protein
MNRRPYDAGGPHIEIPASVWGKRLLRVGRPQLRWRIAIDGVADNALYAGTRGELIPSSRSNRLVSPNFMEHYRARNCVR